MDIRTNLTLNCTRLGLNNCSGAGIAAAAQYAASDQSPGAYDEISPSHAASPYPQSAGLYLFQFTAP